MKPGMVRAAPGVEFRVEGYWGQRWRGSQKYRGDWGAVVSGQWAVTGDRRMQGEEGGKGSHNPLSRDRPYCHAIGGALFLGAIYS
jgi:hypothetical protein